MNQPARLTVYRGCRPVVDVEYGNQPNTTPSEAVIDALATAAGVHPTDLPPLYQFVDPDAIDTLFNRHEGAAYADTILSFRVETWNVFIGAGHIRICDATRLTDPKPVFEHRTSNHRTPQR